LLIRFFFIAFNIIIFIYNAKQFKSSYKMKKTNLKDFLQADVDKIPKKVPEFIDNLIKKIDEHIAV